MVRSGVRALALHPTAVFSISAGLAGCSFGPGDQTRQFQDFRLPEPTALISEQSGLLAGPSGITVDSTGRVWVSDFVGKRVISVNPTGENLLVVGREGRGPGEFEGPLGIVSMPGRIRVVDAFNARFQDYRLDGTHIADVSPAITALGGAAMASDGRFVVPVFQNDSVLAVFHRVDGSRAVRFGAPAASGMQRTREAQWLDVQQARVPQEMRNLLFPAIGDTALYLVMMADAEVRQYDEHGQLRWATVLDVPEVEAIRETFFAARSDTSSGPPQTLMALTQASEIGNSVWVLVNAEASRGDVVVLYLLDGDSGAIEARLSVSLPDAALKFAVDRVRQRLYLTVPSEAAVYAVNISSVPPSLR